MMTKDRAQEILKQAREKATVGPWCDQLDKVMTEEERKRVIKHWDTLSGETSFVDALQSIASNLLCSCEWILNGNPTPDCNVAIGMAVCYNPVSFGEKGSDPFPICEAHAKQKKDGGYWKVLPLPGKTVAQSHPLVQDDDKYFGKIIPDTVIESVKNRFPEFEKYSSILEKIKWDGMNKCFFFMSGNVYTGIELDGYMHQ